MDNSLPWTEKYRPVTLEDVILDENVRKLIGLFMTNKKNQHLLITGTPGIGKTSTIKCIIRNLFENNPNGYIEISATEDKNVKNATSVITGFCRRISKEGTNKMIIFDEADNLTTKCQHDISAALKEYGSNTKFIFICNNSSHIIEDLQSMCRIVRFRNLSNDSIIFYLSKICRKENIEFDEGGMQTLCYIADGDMRRSINDLQRTAYTYNSITKKNVLLVCNVPDPEEIKNIVLICTKGKLIEADRLLSTIIKKGYNFMDIVSCFSVVFERFVEIDEELRLKLISITYKTKINLSMGVRSKLQLSAMLCQIVKICSENI